MAQLTNWYQEEKTFKQIYEGIYPVMVSTATLSTKEMFDDNNKPYNREIVELTFKTLRDVPFPDGTTGKLTFSNSYYQDVQYSKNAFNGIARALGIDKFTCTEDFEGKCCIIGVINREYEKDGETKYVPQLGYGLFSYAPIPPTGANIEYIATEIQGKPTDEQYKEWFKTKLAKYKQPK